MTASCNASLVNGANAIATARSPSPAMHARHRRQERQTDCRRQSHSHQHDHSGTTDRYFIESNAFYTVSSANTYILNAAPE